MNKRIWIPILLVTLAAALIAVLARTSRSQGHRTLEQYKAELRAKGEKLTWAELGFPRVPETNEDFDAFLAAAARLGGGNPALVAGVARIAIAPGQARVSWAADTPLSPQRKRGETNTLSWAELETELNTMADVLAEIRRTVEHPPAFWITNPTNTAMSPVSNTVHRRNATQWLAADCLVALRMKQLERARDDLRAIVQMAEVYRKDYTLISQMMRVTIAGLGLPVTWEALQVNGWSDADLAAMQEEWEKLNLGTGIERGIVGERAFFEHYHEMLHGGLINTIQSPASAAPGNQGSPEDMLNRLILLPLWRANAAADELLYLRLSQRTLDAVRQIDSNEPYGTTRAALAEVNAELSRKGRGLGRYRYLLTSLSLPNYGRALEVAIRRETERRLTLVALALKRHELRHRKLPPDLSALVPEFLKAVPIDPMSGNALVYRLNADGTFALYSVGDDGKDDGGDPHPIEPKSPELWAGRDVVWPAPVFETNAPAGANSTGTR
jgi:hypothetical protein